MLFNSFEFILLFLPISLMGFYLISHYAAGQNHPNAYRLLIWWLVLVSCFFYAWWQPIYLLLIICSMIFNYGMGQAIHFTQQSTSLPNRSKTLLALGICLNLLLLGYYKYAVFLTENFSLWFNAPITLEPIVLPLAISFFTFQQIAYLVDTYQGQTKTYGFAQYALFVTFFPQLIAGPIVHHKEMMPQFSKPHHFSFKAEHFSIGLTLFAIGLFKKVIIADNLSPYVNQAFGAADAQGSMSFFEAWGGALAYTFQLYFDFSGYADMALGAARLFGIRLPENFFSPYKSQNIIEFWRRWHITLSRFLKDYLYIPLGGNRKGAIRRYQNLLITMLLGGLWHGAGWNFIFWGFLHGLYLMINHAWRNLGLKMPTLCGWLITFLAVTLAWVFFRAQSLSGAVNMLSAMFDFTTIKISPEYVMLSELCACFIPTENFMGSIGTTKVWAWIVIASIISFLLPNSLELLKHHHPLVTHQHRDNIPMQWQPSAINGVLGGLGFFICLFSLTKVSEFLYFQF